MDAKADFDVRNGIWPYIALQNLADQSEQNSENATGTNKWGAGGGRGGAEQGPRKSENDKL